MFKQLTVEEEKDFREFANTDTDINNFISKVSLYHPVIRDEIIKRLKD
jgi:hypothetical protein